MVTICQRIYAIAQYISLVIISCKADFENFFGVDGVVSGSKIEEISLSAHCMMQRMQKQLVIKMMFNEGFFNAFGSLF